MKAHLKMRSGEIAAAVALLFLLFLTLLRARENVQPQLSTPSTFDYGRSGYAALYDMLGREGVRVGRFERSTLLLSRDTTTLVLAQTRADLLARGSALHRNEVVALKNWVIAGGRLIVVSPPYGDQGDGLLGIPASRSLPPAFRALPFANLPATRGVRAVSGDFSVVFAYDAAPKALPLLVSRDGIVALEYRLGHGTVVALTDPSMFSNGRLSDADNARFAFNLFAPNGSVAFDETIHGFSSGSSLWNVLPAPAHWAVYVALSAVGLAFIGSLCRFAPALPVAQADDPDSSAYLRAMASLLERAGASRRVMQDRTAFTLRAVRRALGVSDRTALESLPFGAQHKAAREKVRELERLRNLEHPSGADLVHAGTLCVALQREFLA